MEFPKVMKRPEDLFKRDSKCLGLSRNVVLDILVGVSFLLHSQTPSLAGVLAQPLPKDPSAPDPNRAVAKTKRIKVRRHLVNMVASLRPYGLFTYLAHYSHSSHVSHASHASHASSSPGPPEPAPPAVGEQPADVVVAGIMVLRIRASVGGLSPQQRVDLVQRRITEARLEAPITSANITIRSVGSDPAIFVRQHLIITVDLLDAKADNVTQFELAKIWLANFQKALPLL